MSETELNEYLATLLGWSKYYSERRKEYRWCKKGDSFNYLNPPNLLG